MYVRTLISIHFLLIILTLHQVAKWTVRGQLPSITATQNIPTNTFEHKLELWATYVSLHAFIQLISLLFVAFGRLFSDAKDPLSGNEHLIDVRRRIQVNTFEQSVLSVFAQLALLPHLSISVLVPLLSAINILFAVGRICFALGYPRQRVYGFGLTLQPSILAILFSVHRLAISHGLLAVSQKTAVDQFLAGVVTSLRN